jgi:hypothetical protein
MNPAKRLTLFISLASALTGVSERVVTEAQQAAPYLDTFTTLADGVAGSGATDILLRFWEMSIQPLPPDQAAEALLDGRGDAFSPDPQWPFSAMARSLMKLLLLGVWYVPGQTDDEGTIETAALYSESLVWLIAQANPTGASKLAYGHWADPPPPLNTLIGP